MEKKSLIIRLFALVAALACAPGMLAAEAYACYTSSNTTLTFYYDNQRTSRTGTTYDLNTGTNNAGWVNDSAYASVTKVVFDPSFADARPTTTYAWFYGMQILRSILVTLDVLKWLKLRLVNFVQLPNIQPILYTSLVFR